jgi:hypothetical protein
VGHSVWTAKLRLAIGQGPPGNKTSSLMTLGRQVLSGVGSGFLDGTDKLLKQQCPGTTQFNYRFTSFAGRRGQIYPQLSAAAKDWHVCFAPEGGAS